MTLEQATAEAHRRWKLLGFAGRDVKTGRPCVGLVRPGEIGKRDAGEPFDVITLGEGDSFESAFEAADARGAGTWKGARKLVKAEMAKLADLDAAAEGLDG